MRLGGATSLQPLPIPVTPGPELGVGVLVGWEFVFFSLLFFFFNNNRLQSFSKKLGDLIVLVFTGEGCSERLRLRKERNRNSTLPGCTAEFRPFTTLVFARQEVFRFSGAPPTRLRLLHAKSWLYPYPIRISLALPRP